MLVGAGGNITVQTGKEGVLLVDSGFEQTTDKVLAAIKTISTGAIRYIINTHVHGDHTGGNEKIAKAGRTIAGGNVVATIGESAGESAAVIAHENVLKRMSAPTGSQSLTPPGAWPTDTFFVNEKSLFFDGEGIQILHIPAAHTDGDSIVFFRRSDVISAGDVFTPERYPIIDLQRGGSVQGLIAALNQIVHLSIPAEKQEGGTMVIPGHGRLCDQADVVVYRDMVTIVRDRIQDMIKKGMTLEQVKAAKPTLDYDPLYAAANRPPDSFIEAVYKSLGEKK
jgi:glyoxylase-like metal-dependent hydrolase (beta-lactamase superfamily II)